MESENVRGWTTTILHGTTLSGGGGSEIGLVGEFGEVDMYNVQSCPTTLLFHAEKVR